MKTKFPKGWGTVNEWNGNGSVISTELALTLCKQALSGQKESFRKKIEAIDLDTMTYGAFRRKVLEILR